MPNTVSPRQWTPPAYAHNAAVTLAYDELRNPNESIPADGEPLLLIMGLGTSRFWWPSGLCDAFADGGFAVARYDQRDAGESTRMPDTTAGNPIKALFDKRPNPYSSEDMVDDAVAVLDALGWDQAHVFGHSMGGVVAQRLGLRHPSRVLSVTSSAALPSDVSGLRILRHLRLRLLTKLALTRFPDGREGDIAASMAVRRGVSSPGYPFDEAAVRSSIEAEVDSGPRDNKAQSRQIGARWHGASLRELAKPTLVLHGEQDPLLTVSAAERTARSVSGARLRVFPGVGHDIPAELWRTVADEISALAEQADEISQN